MLKKFILQVMPSSLHLSPLKSQLYQKNNPLTWIVNILQCILLPFFLFMNHIQKILSLIFHLKLRWAFLNLMTAFAWTLKKNKHVKTNHFWPSRFSDSQIKQSICNLLVHQSVIYLCALYHTAAIRFYLLISPTVL